MNQALTAIVLHAIKEQYVSEKAFYSGQLGISSQSWDRWKKGEHGLRPDNMNIVSRLFTDYEWMLVQKVSRNADILPEVSENPVREYQFLKYQVAKKWLQTGLATITWKSSENHEHDEGHRKPATTTLRLEASYDFWSYKDILDLRLPSVIRYQIESQKVDLLEWMAENDPDSIEAMK
ncbi:MULTISPECIES: hypothetical protein [unclassified Jeotgalibaca]|uniref:hypothetical protein n=1 Tax=unclassified Jeotgalibaca TaxID=2621505 RepID=UPI003FD2C96D